VSWVDAWYHRVSRRIMTCSIYCPIPSRSIIRLGRAGSWRRCIAGTLLIRSLRLSEPVQIDFEVAAMVLHTDGSISIAKTISKAPDMAEVVVTTHPLKVSTAFSASASVEKTTVPNPRDLPSSWVLISARVTLPDGRKRSFRSCHWQSKGSCERGVTSASRLEPVRTRLSSPLRFGMTMVENVHFQRTGCDQPGSHWEPDSMVRNSAGWELPPSRVAVTFAVVGPQRLIARPMTMTTVPQMVAEIAVRV